LQINWVGDSDAVVLLNRSKIQSVGVPAVAAFLRQLQVFKATADFARGGALYRELTTVSPHFLKLRKVVMEQKKPRPVFCQVDSSFIFRLSPVIAFVKVVSLGSSNHFA
jgi:dipeptidyl-peptidase-3